GVSRPDSAELASDARYLEPPRGLGEGNAQVQARPRHVSFERSRATRGRAHVVEEAQHPKRLWVARLVATVVPGDRIAAPDADAERVRHLEKRHLVPWKAQATRGRR